MNNETFRILRQMLMEQLDLSRELTDKEILEQIDELLLDQGQEVHIALKDKVILRQELFYSVRKLDVLQTKSQRDLIFCLYRRFRCWCRRWCCTWGY